METRAKQMNLFLAPLAVSGQNAAPTLSVPNLPELNPIHNFSSDEEHIISVTISVYKDISVLGMSIKV